MDEHIENDDQEIVVPEVSAARIAFERGDYYEAKRLVHEATGEDAAFLKNALALDKVLIIVPIILFIIWLSATLSF